jgi:diguanylate cyclase (GGDEF)-like protein
MVWHRRERAAELSSPILLSSFSLAPEQRWRLVASLYEDLRPLVEGGLGLLAVLAVCALRAPSRWLIPLAASAVLVTALRMLLCASYRRRVADIDPLAPDPAAGSPDLWALRFVAGACATSLVWGATSLFVLLRSADPQLQLLILLAQAGWLGAASVRNAASPAAVVGQCLCCVLPTIAGLILCAPGFVQAAAPFVLLQLMATLGIARYLGAHIVISMVSEQRLAGANAQLLRLSAHDDLTRIANRRSFDIALQVEWARAARAADDIALLLIDVDHFAAYNKLYRTLAGDDCLRLIAGQLQSAARRPADLVARFGGAMFAAVLPGTSEEGAREVAERVRHAVEDAAISHSASPSRVVTVSIGVASMAPQPGSDMQALITLADRALCDAKQGGRNQVRGAASRLPIGSWRERRARRQQNAPAPDVAATSETPAASTGDAMPPAHDGPLPKVPPGLKVLVLEDDRMVALLLEDMLGEIGCSVVGPCERPVEALALIESQSPQVALLDVHLAPGTDGYAVADALAARHVPFAFVTGDGGTRIPAEFADRDVLLKPFRLAILVRLLADLAQRNVA